MAYSQSHHKMSEQGKLGHTLWGRENPDGMVIGEGVIKMLTEVSLQILKRFC